jgi:DNA excision repair protein ERCC-5
LAACQCSGIGIVNAIEVVNAFSEEDGLKKFKDWLDSPDYDIFDKPLGKTKGKGKSGGRGDKANVDDGLNEDGEGNLNHAEAGNYTVAQKVWMHNHVSTSLRLL